jgi:hypothetical protein
MVPSLLGAFFLTGCTPECEGAGCGDIYGRARFARLDVSGWPEEVDPRGDTAWESTVEQGVEVALHAADDALWMGLPATGEVLRWDPEASAPEVALTGDPAARFGASVAAWRGYRVVTSDAGEAGETRNTGLVEAWLEEERAWWVGGEARGDRFGAQLLACGDLDADGADDLAIVAPDVLREGVPTGAVYVLATGDGPLLGRLPTGQLRRVDGVQPGERLGSGVACDADLTGDGVVDLALGAPGAAGAAGAGAGVVRIFAGGTDVARQPAAVTLEGPEAEAWLGVALTTGDLDGDGVLELVAGASGVDGLGPDVAGAVLGWSAPLVTGTPADWRVEGVQARGRFGETLAFADLDGDGATDLAVGAPGHNPTGEDGAVASGAVFGFRGPLVSGERVANEAEMRVVAARQYLETGRRFAVWAPRQAGPSRLVLATRAATRE